MRRYCLDANVFIQAKNGPYGFDIVPAFWNWLDQQASVGVIFSSTMVYEELYEGNDDLADWVHDRRNSGFFVEHDANTQRIFQTIADYINQNYPPHQAQLFLDRADPWVISLAKAANAIVVTHEARVGDNSSVVKIPNICQQFDVAYMNPYQMMRELRAKFELA
jgi:predicted nuclease of predicted toxin-antitoxin system